jgi:lipopolysaccharide export system protein LptC
MTAPIESDVAKADEAVKQGWAKPGSSHDRLIRLLKFGLPALIGVALAFLLLVPLNNRREISFLLDKNKVPEAEQRLRSDAAQYRGQDEAGRPFVLDAREAVQQTGADPVDITGMSARLQLDDGPAQLTADRARFDPRQEIVDVISPILFQSADGYRLTTSNVRVDLRGRSLESQSGVQGQMPLGTFEAGGLAADLPGRKVVLTNGARLHIVQGGLNRQP